MSISEESLIELLEECTLFKGMSPQEISLALSGHMGRIHSYARDAMIAQAGDEVSFLHILLKGSVKGEMVDFTGKTIKIEDIESPRPLAPAFLFAADNTYPVDIVANEHVKIILVPKRDFLNLMSMDERVLTNYLRIISSRAQFLSGKLRFLSFQSIKGKISHYLLELSTRRGQDEIIIDKSQLELAELFGVARPSLARALREMHNDGLIEASGKKIKLMDRQKLSDLLK